MTKHKVAPLVGIKSFAALTAFQRLLLGFKQIPMYIMMSHSDFVDFVCSKSESERETLIREAVALNTIPADDVETLCSFCQDKNGVPYSYSTLRSAPVADIHEMIVAVCLELTRIKVDLVGEAEKKS